MLSSDIKAPTASIENRIFNIVINFITWLIESAVNGFSYKIKGLIVYLPVVIHRLRIKFTNTFQSGAVEEHVFCEAELVYQYQVFLDEAKHSQYEDHQW